MAHLNIPKFFNNEARSLIDARLRCIDIHGDDIRAAGNEVEIAVRQWLSRMLPDNVSVGHGHIIDSNSQISPQVDCILRNGQFLPTLFTASDGTQYTPVDSVFAYGEIKSTYRKSARYIQDFAETKKRMREELSHALVENTCLDGIRADSLFSHMVLGSSQKYLNRIFTFMIFVDAGDADADDLEEIYSSIDDKFLPDVAVLLNRCVILKGKRSSDTPHFEIYRNGDLAPLEVKWCIAPAARQEGAHATSEGKHLGVLYYLLMNHIKESLLEPPNVHAYLRDLLAGFHWQWKEIKPHRGSEPEDGPHEEQKD